MTQTTASCHASVFEKHLGTLDGDQEHTQVQLVQVARPHEVPTLELRTQVYSGDMGWVTLRRIGIAAGQMGALRDALNMMDPDARDSSCGSKSMPAQGLSQTPTLRLIG